MRVHLQLCLLILLLVISFVSQAHCDTRNLLDRPARGSSFRKLIRRGMLIFYSLSLSLSLSLSFLHIPLFLQTNFWQQQYGEEEEEEGIRGMEMTSQAQTVCLENPRILPQILIVAIRPVFQERQVFLVSSS